MNTFLDLYHVERFTNSLIMFDGAAEYINQICTTLVRMVNDKTGGIIYAQQFIRATARIFTSLEAQTRPEKFKDPLSACKQRCRTIFMVG